MDAVLGRSAVFLDARREVIRRRESNLGSFMADLARSVTGAEVALLNGGNFRSSIPAGDVTARLQDYSPAQNHLLVKNISAMGLYWGSYRKKAPEMLESQFGELMSWYRQGKLDPHISHLLPLEEAGAALDLLTSRKATGKVVLSCSRS